MIWMKSFGSEKSDVAYRVAADEDCETIYVGGQSVSCAQFSTREVLSTFQLDSLNPRPTKP